MVFSALTYGLRCANLWFAKTYTYTSIQLFLRNLSRVHICARYAGVYFQNIGVSSVSVFCAMLHLHAFISSAERRTTI